MSKIEKIFPTEEELSFISSEVRCPTENCWAVFKSTSNLNMHLIRHHKVSGEELCRKDSVRQFYCPVKVCIYNKDSEKYFKKLKYLKQHFLKVHAVKNFTCNKCNKKFATEAFKNMHNKTCGSTFTCSCGSIYNSVEALLTHCRRKGHVTFSSFSGKYDKINTQQEPIERTENNMNKRSERLICPKLISDVSHPVHYIAAIALSELSTPCNLSKAVDKSIQTEFCKSGFWKDFKKSPSNTKTEKKQNNSQQTQTSSKCKNTKISAETQTTVDYLKQKCKSPPKVVSTKKRKKSMETQTKEFMNIVLMQKNQNKDDMKVTGFLNTEILSDDLFQDMSSFGKDGNNLNDSIKKDSCSFPITLNNAGKSHVKTDELFNGKRRTVSPVNPPSGISVKHELFSNSGVDLSICNKEFESDFSELNSSNKKIINENEGLNLMETGSYNVFDINKLCNIETQTEIDNFLTECSNDSTFMLCSTTETQTTDFDSLLYSNMCTQTCDEVDQLFNFNFVDIETQTAWPDL